MKPGYGRNAKSSLALSSNISSGTPFIIVYAHADASGDQAAGAPFSGTV